MGGCAGACVAVGAVRPASGGAARVGGPRLGSARPPWGARRASAVGGPPGGPRGGAVGCRQGAPHLLVTRGCRPWQLLMVVAAAALLMHHLFASNQSTRVLPGFLDDLLLVPSQKEKQIQQVNAGCFLWRSFQLHELKAVKSAHTQQINEEQR